MKSVNVDVFVLWYLKCVEVEENWLRNYCEMNIEEYIKRVWDGIIRISIGYMECIIWCLW